MKVRRPECDEQPSILSELYSRWNHKRTVAGDNHPPLGEEDRPFGGGHVPRPVCNATSAASRSGCRGMVRPPVFLYWRGWARAAPPYHLRPGASVTMAQVSEAISLARRPAFIDNRNITRSRAG